MKYPFLTGKKPCEREEIAPKALDWRGILQKLPREEECEGAILRIVVAPEMKVSTEFNLIKVIEHGGIVLFKYKGVMLLIAN